MPFVAELDGHVVDLTLKDDAVWSRIWRRALGTRLRCPECHAPVRAKQMSATRTRFVSHVPGQTVPCSLVGESPEHRQFKLKIVQLLRDRGWTAQPEVAGSGWRADVLATHPSDSRRSVIFEIQLSTQTVDEALRRQAVLSGAGHQVVWLARRRPTWIRQVPTWCVQQRSDDEMVIDGVFEWSHRLETFTQSEATPLATVLDSLLAGTLIWEPELRTYGPMGPARLRSGPWPPERGDGGWHTVAERMLADEHRVELEKRTRQRAEHQEAIARQAEERRQRSLSQPSRSSRSSSRSTAAGLRRGGSGEQSAATYNAHGSELSTATNLRAEDLLVRRGESVEQVQRVAAERSWKLEVFPGDQRSYFGTVLVVEGRLIVVEPTGVRQGRWPGAIVIANPRIAEAKGVDDLTVMTLDEWVVKPELGTGLPADALQTRDDPAIFTTGDDRLPNHWRR